MVEETCFHGVVCCRSETIHRALSASKPVSVACTEEVENNHLRKATGTIPCLSTRKPRSAQQARVNSAEAPAVLRCWWLQLMGASEFRPWKSSASSRVSRTSKLKPSLFSKVAGLSKRLCKVRPHRHPDSPRQGKPCNWGPDIRHPASPRIRSKPCACAGTVHHCHYVPSFKKCNTGAVYGTWECIPTAPARAASRHSCSDIFQVVASCLQRRNTFRLLPKQSSTNQHR